MQKRRCTWHCLLLCAQLEDPPLPSLRPNYSNSPPNNMILFLLMPRRSHCKNIWSISSSLSAPSSVYVIWRRCLCFRAAPKYFRRDFPHPVVVLDKKNKWQKSNTSETCISRYNIMVYCAHCANRCLRVSFLKTRIFVDKNPPKITYRTAYLSIIQWCMMVFCSTLTNRPQAL